MESASDRKRLLALSFSALGIVFGDLGTSPLYAFGAAIGHLPLTTNNIYGILSLIFWTLIILICFKYLFIVFRADNDGEGGVIALAGVIQQKLKNPGIWLLFMTIFGVGLIIGDGILTPAISILSAIEGLESLSTHFKPFIIPITLIILLLLFRMQNIGTGKIGIIFAPSLLIWFITIGILGLIQIIQNPNVLMAVNPYYFIHFCIEQKTMAILTFGGVFLVMTGGEALYADLGHFGKTPIRIAWFSVVLPALLLTYFGQGALLLAHPESIAYTFYGLSPHWFLPFLIVLATFATIIASQAIISAAFSILKQTSLLNLVPRLKIVYTSTLEKGQVYLPFINFILFLGTCTLVLTFESSSNLANAFGIAVNLDMILTTILVSIVAYYCWNWRLFKLIIFPAILIIELVFFAGNVIKIVNGGWIPILIAFFAIVVMYTWYCGFEKLRELQHRDSLFGQYILDELNQNKISRLPGTTLFITDSYDYEGGSLLHQLRINRIIYETMIFLSIKVESKPYIPIENKFKIIKKANGLYLLNIHYGFAENVDLPSVLDAMLKNVELPFVLDQKKLVYFLEIVSMEVTTKKTPKMWHWQKLLFSLMLRNAVFDIHFYRLPFNKTIAIGNYYHI
jgi:KUP system potassium uptake protein